MKTYLKKSIQCGVKQLHTISSIADFPYMHKKNSLNWPPIFILGVPRSGTTLLYQLLMSAFKFSYLPNVSNKFFMAPLTAANLGKKICKPYESTFQSQFGYEEGCMAPSEAGNVWNRWFPHENVQGYNFTPANYLTKNAQTQIYNLIANVENIFAAPFITKNVKMGVRIQALEEIFENPLYVYIQRDWVDIILSNLVMRRKRNVDWASVMPRQIDEIKDLPEVQQVCRQIFFVEQNIKEDLPLDNTRILNVSYDDLCDSPGAFLDDFTRFANENGIQLQQLSAETPASFDISKSKQHPLITTAELNEIIDFVTKNGVVEN